MKALVPLAILGLLFGGSLWARPTAGEVTSPEGGASSAAAAPEKGGGQSLFEQTLPLDIDTAGYYELLAWMRMLGLSEAGTRTDLQARLRAYYHLPPPAPSQPGQKKARTITIISAGMTEYFTLEKVGEKYIRLSGGVDLEMYDPSTDTTHSIIADTVVFNQTEKTITAIGHITYTLTGKGKTEIFRGQSLTFNVDNWEGIFFEGVSESKKTINSSSLTFFYSGQKITRTKNDVVTLDNGTITSSEAAPPNYQIKARKIWILAPGEWALRGATLYVGRIPLFYFPYFFYPGDNLIFHPSMGYRQEEGYYLQTTTYLLGRRQKQSSSLSFLQTAEDTNVTYNTEVRGLFLHKTTPVTSAEQSSTPYDFENSYIRIVLDIYSRLGVFAGIESKFVNFGIIKDFEFKLDLARSRDIFLVGGNYTQFLPLSDGTTTTVWNTSNLGPVNLPFRYGTDLELQLANNLVSFAASVPFYSDPYFVRDFGRRNESVDWSKILGLSGSTTTGSTSAATTAAALPTPLTSLLWSIHTTLTANTAGLAPFVGDAELTNLDASVLWQTKARNTAQIPGYSLGGSAYASDFTFPEQQFFYPQSIIFPSVAAKLSGTIFSSSPTIPGASAGPGSSGGTAPPTPPATAASTNATSGSTTPGTATSTSAVSPSTTTGGAAATATTGTSTTTGASATVSPAGAAGSSAQSQAAPGQGSAAQGGSPPAAPAQGTSAAKPSVGDVLPPWAAGAAPSSSESGQGQLKPEPPLPDVPISAPPSLSPYGHSLTYSIVPSLSVENRPVADSWTSPADINLSNAYSIFTGIGTGSLTYAGALQNTLLDFQDTSALSGSYKIHYNRNSSIPNWQSFLNQDYDTTFLKLTNSLNVQSAPFQQNDVLTGSSVQYAIAGQLFSRAWVAGTTEPLYQNSFLSWDKQHITTHTLNVTLDVTPDRRTSSLSVASTLPPLDPKLASTLVTGPLTSIVTAAWTKPLAGGPYLPQPLGIEEILTPLPWLTLDTKAIYVFNSENAWDSGTTSITATSSNKLFSAQESFSYNLRSPYPTDSLTSVKVGFFTAAFEAQYTYPQQFVLPNGWIQEPNQEFMPSTLSFGVDYQYKSEPLWKNRINFSTHIQSAWNMNLIQVTNNSLTLNLGATLSIYRFLDLSFSLQSEDRATYRYFPSYAGMVDQTPINPITDFLKSINFFNRSDREQSNFKMQSVDLKLVHHLGDWDLSLEYTGTPQLTTSSSGLSYYQWTPTFTIAVTWVPVPEIKSNIAVDSTGNISY